jgi:hypothetical protein
MISFECKECSRSFGSQRSLHAHIKRHGLMLGDYYVKHFQRRNKLTGELLPFKNCEDYFDRDFSRPEQIFEWCEKHSRPEVQTYLLELLRKRINKKNLDYGPTYLDLASAGYPSVDFYKKYFGSYTEACRQCNVKPLLGAHLPKSFWGNYSNYNILIDTREQKPLEFNKSSVMKLDVGDYAVTGSLYNYTFVDRKSFTDYCTTVTAHYNRFAKELDRCRKLGCYMFVVIDQKFEHMEEKNKKHYKRFNLDYVYHNMRELQAEYSDCCQFVFSGSRRMSSLLIPKLLILGKQLWKTDIQYFWSNFLNYELAHRKTDITKSLS